MFTVALFTIAKTRKQLKCPLTDEWIKMWYIHNNGVLLSHKKEWNNAVCCNMDRPGDNHTMWSTSDKDKYIAHMQNLKKKDASELTYQTETDSET